jgi:hypothetical protein
MPQSKAKVFARLFDYSVPDGSADASMRFTIEYKLLTGTRKGGKVSFLVNDIQTQDRLTDDLRDLLAAHLSTTFAPIVFRPRDIVGYSV